MKSNRWLPIIIMLGLTGLGVFVGVNTILNTRQSKPYSAPNQAVLCLHRELLIRKVKKKT